MRWVAFCNLLSLVTSFFLSLYAIWLAWLALSCTLSVSEISGFIRLETSCRTCLSESVLPWRWGRLLQVFLRRRDWLRKRFLFGFRFIQWPVPLYLKLTSPTNFSTVFACLRDRRKHFCSVGCILDISGNEGAHFFARFCVPLVVSQLTIVSTNDIDGFRRMDAWHPINVQILVTDNQSDCELFMFISFCWRRTRGLWSDWAFNVDFDFFIFKNSIRVNYEYDVSTLKHIKMTRRRIHPSFIELVCIFNGFVILRPRVVTNSNSKFYISS